MLYDTLLFCEIIESIKGVHFIREDYNAGVKARFYEGLNGTLVIIDVSDESLPNELVMIYLVQLGLKELIPSIFPPEPKESDYTKPLVLENLSSDACDDCKGVGVVERFGQTIPCDTCMGKGNKVSVG